MAYVAFDQTGAVLHPSPVAAPAHDLPLKAAPPARLSALEWSVVAIARADSLASLRTPGRMSTALRTVFRQSNPRLADERLEALRRIAVLSWHHSFQVPASEIRAFLAAGFTVGQYETMMASISAARAQQPRRR